MNLVGKSFNGYVFLEALGSGSFGAVYRVEKNGQAYAAKVLSETYILQEFQHEENRITREIDVLKLVNHESLIKYEEDFYFKDEFRVTQYVIVMEYFEGITLKDYLVDTHSMSELSDIFKKILAGVKALHNTTVENCGIIHRDLKPANIMINDALEVKIIDYGLSKIIDFSSITSTGAQIGSPLYMAPEQLKDSKHIDVRADIYALGIILYEMVTRNLPYKAITIPELFLKIINEPIVPPKQYNPEISDDLEKIIYKATAKEPFARFQTAVNFEDAFVQKHVESELDIPGAYYAWIYKEKDVTIEFEKTNDCDIIYPIHVKNWSKSLHKYFEAKDFDNIIIDPSTQRLSYYAFSATTGLVELPYAPKRGVISLSLLQNHAHRAEYLKRWYNTVSMGKKLILPYHYISNTEYPVEQVENWIKMNIQLINESIQLVSPEQKRYAMISIGLAHLVFDANKVLSYYIHADVDGFIVQVSDMRQLNEQSLKSYIDFMVNLQKYTNKPVIALKVPTSLGLALIASGIHGFSLGLASIDYFDEGFIKEERDAFNLYAKYYFPQLMSFLSYPKKDNFEFEKIYTHFGTCSCRWCYNRTAIEIATGDKGTQLHCWQKTQDEVQEINSVPKSNRIAYIRSRIASAISEFESIPPYVTGNLKNNDYYKLLKYLKKVI